MTKKPIDLWWYTRLSQEEKEKKTESIKNQKKLGERIAKELRSSFLWINEGIQKSHDRTRPKLQEMLKQARKYYNSEHTKDRELIIGFKKLSRLGRDQSFVIEIINEMRKLGIKIIDSNKKDLREEKLLGFQAALDEMHITEGREEHEKMIQNRKEEKQPIGRPPIGYKTKNKTWIIDKKGAEKVIQIYHDFQVTPGITFSELGRMHKTSDKTIKKILTNKAYIGIMSVKHKYKKLELEWELDKNIKRIIHKEVFKQVQERIKNMETKKI